MALLTAPTIASPLCERIASCARTGLTRKQKMLPPWLFYDNAGSELFERITELPEYYLTRTERAIFSQFSDAIVARAAGGKRLRVAELGAGTAGKTQVLLAAALRRQQGVVYEPIDVSRAALDEAQNNIERELPGVSVEPSVMDYTDGLALEPAPPEERRLMLYIGSSVGNFEPIEACALLRDVRTSLAPGDGLLLGVDNVKDIGTLLSAYHDAAGVTAAFNRNILVRLNQELDGDFDPDTFVHHARWNAHHARIEMHLESRIAQTVHLRMIDLTVPFVRGETIHTENSYKYAPGVAETLLTGAGFKPELKWTDPQGWFSVHLARVP